MQYYERLAYQEGASFIAGVDEVGRGPLAGSCSSCCSHSTEEY